MQSPSKLHFKWPVPLDLAALNPVAAIRQGRKRSNSKAKARFPGHENVAALQTSFSVSQSVRALRRHKWSWFDLQYIFLASLCTASLFIIGVHAPLIKTAAALGYTLLLFMPATRQFFLPSWPIWTYLLYFFSSRYVIYPPVSPVLTVESAHLGNESMLASITSPVPTW